MKVDLTYDRRFTGYYVGLGNVIIERDIMTYNGISPIRFIVVFLTDDNKVGDILTVSQIELYNLIQNKDLINIKVEKTS